MKPYEGYIFKSEHTGTYYYFAGMQKDRLPTEDFYNLKLVNHETLEIEEEMISAYEDDLKPIKVIDNEIQIITKPGEITVMSLLVDNKNILVLVKDNIELLTMSVPAAIMEIDELVALGMRTLAESLEETKLRNLYLER